MGSERDIPFNLISDFEPSDAQEFIELDGGSPSLNFRIAASNQAIAGGDYDGILYEQHYDAVMPNLEADSYVRFCDKTDIPFGCQTNLVLDRVGLVGLATLRKRKDGRTTEYHRQVFAHAASSARRAVRLQERLEGDQARLLAGAFDVIRAAAFILDERGGVQAMTQAAETIVSTGDVALRDRQLAADGTPLSLGRAVAALVAPDGLDHLRLRVDVRPGRSPIFLEGFKLPTRAWSLGHLPHVILAARKPQRDRAGIAAFLAALYSFTLTDADIAMRLHDGATRAEIAAARRVTAETLRGQIKTIYAKTGSRDEADLMRIMASIMT